ncbi:hypothetical protein [Pseudoalteromonas sp. 1_2015MBL_MicDiv]|uniref:hypothetical protein n=1 Tax=Pseudoalteromonas sp. 1_2015MBL_MicDiv TaxID=1720343 RepID=UPI000BBEBBE9|nr:hypothetical protein [Pseudoalteromonas sp. 1_2015MBL_MicDiv]ATG78203.1 hypothetical protein AOR04_12115 [Pseudoalteromonas sp. 1_2015MBL_MicDiv]
MSKTQKKQTLLGKTPAKKKQVQQRRPRTASQGAISETQSTTISSQGGKETKSKKGLIITLSIALLIIITFPKPTLLTYKKLGMVSESIYWPGVFGYGATIIDSNLHPQLDSRRKSLYLCTNPESLNNCQKYQVIADHGLFAAIGSYFKH